MRRNSIISQLVPMPTEPGPCTEASIREAVDLDEICPMSGVTEKSRAYHLERSNVERAAVNLPSQDVQLTNADVITQLRDIPQLAPIAVMPLRRSGLSIDRSTRLSDRLDELVEGYGGAVALEIARTALDLSDEYGASAVRLALGYIEAANQEAM